MLGGEIKHFCCFNIEVTEEFSLVFFRNFSFKVILKNTKGIWLCELHISDVIGCNHFKSGPSIQSNKGVPKVPHCEYGQHERLCGYWVGSIQLHNFSDLDGLGLRIRHSVCLESKIGPKEFIYCKSLNRGPWPAMDENTETLIWLCMTSAN